MNQLCKVCGEPAAGFHFGAFTCEGCKSFFGRTYNNVSGVSECKNGGRCEITKKNRTSCKSCRLRKCLSVGMSKSGSRYGRRSNWFKIHCLLSAQNQQNGSSPETNNNNSTITNNNTNNHHHNSHNSLGKTHLPSTITSLSSHSGHGSESDRERTPGSSASRNGSNGLQPQAFTSLAGLSPDSREHILSTLNRKLVNPDLCDYFRATSGGLGGGGVVGSGKPYYQEEDRGEDISRTTRSPGSLESPNSEASVDDVKSNTPMFTMPGSPLDVKPNDLLSFDLLTRDLMKLGYDPLRLWPAMLTTPPNLHSFNPYRFIFPNFPGAAAAFPGAFPPTPNGPPPMNGLHHGKLLSASTLTSEASCNNIPSPLSSLQNNSSATNHNHSLSPSSPPPTPIRNRVVPIVPPTSSLTLTPPISHHGADDSCFAAQKFRNLPVQDSPIDLSARATNNNHIDDYDTKKFSRVKSEFSSAMSDMDEDENQENESDRDLSDHERKREIRSDYGDSDEDDEGEDLRSTSHLRLRRSSNNNNSNCSRRSSCSRSPKRERVATPLDLTRSTNTNSSPPTKIVAT